jgi:hypothetical protein
VRFAARWVIQAEQIRGFDVNAEGLEALLTPFARFCGLPMAHTHAVPSKQVPPPRGHSLTNTHQKQQQEHKCN